LTEWCSESPAFGKLQSVTGKRKDDSASWIMTQQDNQNDNGQFYNKQLFLKIKIIQLLKQTTANLDRNLGKTNSLIENDL
jgi:hypothetical protein